MLSDEKETEQISLKKAYYVSYSNFKDKMISVEYISKKAKEMCHSIFILSKKIKTRIFKERRREIKKNKS